VILIADFKAETIIEQEVNDRIFLELIS